MPDLSIIIVNWNSANYLRVCLDTVYRFTQGISIETIVIDNASNDGCHTMLAAEFPHVRFIASQLNLGFASANNVAFKEATADLLLFLNPDTEIASDVFTRMVMWMRANPGFGAAGPRLLNTDGTLQESCVQAFPTILNQVLDSDFLRRRYPSSALWGTAVLYTEDAGPATVDAISGASFMATRQAFENAGLFTEDYFMYSDDLDLSYKIWHAGYKVACLTDCEVVHHGGKSSSQQSNHFAAVLQRESMAQYFAKTRGRIYSLAYRLLMGFSALLRVAAALVLLVLTTLSRHNASARALVQKWFAILAWSFGFQSWTRTTGARTHA
jgi:N-acetylglucosaminyl-diphospho-decaprenol L-rhamnosyltransferase